MRKPNHLSALDSNALVARLALVKERVLEDAAAANPYGPHDPSEMNTAKTRAQLAAERADPKRSSTNAPSGSSVMKLSPRRRRSSACAR